ncbi:MAG TPA: tRNA adenosine(34) deaminase TadA [Spongiibacteraceae bacterium]|nr:tRNA adenosine(34) deaminase TadA [Spongiibacteraceae bacterium]
MTAVTLGANLSEALVEKTDEYWMQLALEQARLGAQVGEVPVGAVLVQDNQLIAAGFNQPISGCDPTAHAEIVALRAAANNLKNYRLPDTTLYVTIEPCAMCAGALVHSRIKRLVYGATEPRAGAIISSQQLLDGPQFNHRIEVEGGVLAEQCGEIMQKFFREKRGS